MLTSKLIHPQILEALGSSGHGTKILVPDGNYPFNTGANPGATRVYLNFAPGKLTVTDVVEGLATAVPIEAAEVMSPDQGDEPSIFAEFRRLLPGIELQKHGRFPFYDVAREPNVALVIATGDQRLYANILLTIGVVKP